jgi:hypothetical protein
MNKITTKIIIGFLIMSYVNVLGNNGMSKNQTDIDYVKYGTSIEECNDYCNKSILISESNINFEKSGRDLDSKLPNILISETISSDYWVQLAEAIDFEKFIQLESMVSSEGDTEWIEIKKKDKIYKVSFEHGKEPETLKTYIGFLRTYMAFFEIDSKETVNFNKRIFINKTGKIKNFFCSRGCSQYVIELIENNKTTYYFDKELESKYRKDGLSIRFNGILQNDFTVINKPGANDVPVPDFKAKNIKLINANINSD